LNGPVTGWLGQADGDPLVTTVTGRTATTGSTGRGGRVRRAGPGGPVRVHVWPGELGRPVLLALHTRLEGGGVFGPLAAALGRRWTVVAPDAPGHGGTCWTPSPGYALDDQVPGAVAVLDALPVVAGRQAPVVVLGHGTGAPAAASVAAARPKVVRHLVLEDPAGPAGSRSRSAGGCAGGRPSTSPAGSSWPPPPTPTGRPTNSCRGRPPSAPWTRRRCGCRPRGGRGWRCGSRRSGRRCCWCAATVPAVRR
jgi:pimeloyl-ACP methyl ester carboxylesterase